MHFKQTLLLGCVTSTCLLSGCTTTAKANYNPADFIAPDRVVEKTVRVQAPLPQVNATLGFGDNPALIKAYREYLKKGEKKNIQSEGIKTYAYDPYGKPPVLACTPLSICTIQLEKGEKPNGIMLGDNYHWTYSKTFIGSGDNGDFSYAIAIKPKNFNIATDIQIPTNKRLYVIRLVSLKGSYTHVMNFYYPRETEQRDSAKMKLIGRRTDHDLVISKGPAINLSKVNFNYTLSGDNPVWTPTRVFDDGDKTYIQMPPISERFNLPVLYIRRNGANELVNYRYRRPYYIIDSLFQEALLVSGRGGNAIKVQIDNKNFA